MKETKTNQAKEIIEEFFKEAKREIGDCYPFLTTEKEKDQEAIDKYNKLVYFFFKTVLENLKKKMIKELT